MCHRPARADHDGTRSDDGNLLAVICITWAFTLLGLRYLQRGTTQDGVGMSAVAIGNLFASVAAAPFALPLPVASASEWATIAYLGVCQIAVAYVFLTTAMRVLPALEVSLLLLIEPVLNPDLDLVDPRRGSRELHDRRRGSHHRRDSDQECL